MPPASRSSLRCARTCPRPTRKRAAAPTRGPGLTLSIPRPSGRGRDLSVHGVEHLSGVPAPPFGPLPAGHGLELPPVPAVELGRSEEPERGTRLPWVVHGGRQRSPHPGPGIGGGPHRVDVEAAGGQDPARLA